MDNFVSFRRPLHCRAGHSGSAVAAIAAGPRRRGGARAHPADPAADLAHRAAGDAGTAVRISGRADRKTAAHYRAVGDPDCDPGLSERRDCLCAQPHPRCPAQCRLPLGADRRIEFLRARGRCGDRAVRLSIRCGACDRRRRVGRSAGDALGGADCVAHAWLVRARADRLVRSRTSMVDATKLRTRAGTLADAAAIAAIYNDGIADRIATFETDPRSAGQMAEWFTGWQLVIVAETEETGPVAFAASFPYSDRACYSGIGEFSVYVRRDYRGRGAGRAVLAALIEAAIAARMHKLTSRVFPENIASRALLKRLGFEEIGIHRRHGKLDGLWRDCVIVERLLDEDQ